MTRQTREDIVSFLVIAIIIGIVFTILWVAPPIVFGAIAIPVALLAFKEFSSFYKIESFVVRSTGFLGLVILAALLLQVLLFPELPLVVSLSLAFVLLVSITALQSKNPRYEEFSRLSVLLFGILYIALPFSFLIVIRFMPQGRQIITILLLVVWAREQGAGLGGFLFPRVGPALNREVNPGKSYIGALIGLFTAVLVTIVLTNLLSLGFSLFQAVAWGLTIGVVCQLGDLSESYLKRAAGRRHSSGLLGPEGGLLDVLDAFSFAVVATYFLFFIFNAPA